ncbi:Ada metal-binding domain-containing protein [Mucilaginibacter ginkgonis]|uniref:Metal-binding protein n=1 Tax=Mucilaginibacter ginkgonis TaxID=2682091 RepID=A0A6I4I2P8_9SPHI|nr:Ada metal-binding domain-containing protein [Mucilaginibacter ginkgonis]QQL49510.1 metal-binding protein [Mucilaginibacter ginkgonis]
MIRHQDLGETQFSRNRNLLKLVRQGKLSIGGNHIDKIYGRLNCKSGKRMNVQNRVFFTDENEALQAGYRPCAHCMREKYNKWKNQNGK